MDAKNLPVAVSSVKSSENERNTKSLPKKLELSEKVLDFASRKSELISNIKSLRHDRQFVVKNDTSHHEKLRGFCRNELAYAHTPPLENFIPLTKCDELDKIFADLRTNDIIYAEIDDTSDCSANLHLLCTGGLFERDLSGLEIHSVNYFDEFTNAGIKITDLKRHSLLQGIIDSIDVDNKTVHLAFKNLDETKPNMGIISEDDLPIYYRDFDSKRSKSYEKCLTDSRGFNNPSCIDALCEKLSLPVLGGCADFSTQKCAPHLRLVQTHSLALKSVERGVEKLRQQEDTVAMQHFNKALQIEPENVEALVARGALYANSKSFDIAVGDFTKALQVDAGHPNAKKYLIETLIAQCEAFRVDKKLKRCKQRARILLQHDPANEYANKILGMETASHSGSMADSNDEKEFSDKNYGDPVLDRNLRNLYEKYGLDEKTARDPDFLSKLKKYREKFGVKMHYRKSSDDSKKIVSMVTVNSGSSSKSDFGSSAENSGDSSPSSSSSVLACSSSTEFLDHRTKRREILEKSGKLRNSSQNRDKPVRKSPDFAHKRKIDTNGSLITVTAGKLAEKPANAKSTEFSSSASKPDSTKRLKKLEQDLKNMESFVNSLKNKTK